MVADKVDALVCRVGFAPRLPNNARCMRDDVFDSATLQFYFVAELLFFPFRLSSFVNSGREHQSCQGTRSDEDLQQQKRSVRTIFYKWSIAAGSTPDSYAGQNQRCRGQDSLV